MGLLFTPGHTQTCLGILTGQQTAQSCFRKLGHFILQGIVVMLTQWGPRTSSWVCLGLKIQSAQVEVLAWQMCLSTGPQENTMFLSGGMCV